MKTVSVEKLREEYGSGKCIACGKILKADSSYVCEACRNRHKIFGSDGIAKYVLIRHLLELVREGRT